MAQNAAFRLVTSRRLPLYQLSLAAATTITPAFAGAVLVIEPQALWLLLAALMAGAAALVYSLERRLPAAALRAVESSDPQPDAGEPACAAEARS